MLVLNGIEVILQKLMIQFGSESTNLEILSVYIGIIHLICTSNIVKNYFLPPDTHNVRG